VDGEAGALDFGRGIGYAAVMNTYTLRCVDAQRMLEIAKSIDKYHGNLLSFRMVEGVAVLRFETDTELGVLNTLYNFPGVKQALIKQVTR